MTTLWWIIAGTVGISLLSLVGAAVLFLREAVLKKILLPLVALSAGALLGGALFHLIPEGIVQLGNTFAMWLWVAIGFSFFLLLEQFIYWHHCHVTPSEHEDHKHPVTYLILLSDALHNFMDGLVLAGAFLVSVKLGWVTFLVLAAHEIPQELGDFGVLLHGGWSKGKALLFNLLSGLTMVLGGLLVYFLSATVEESFLLPLAAGGFIYIAASDLIPEIKHHNQLKVNILHFLFFILGAALIVGVGVLG
ncbi:ZIP family metal transporter [Candidatus Falkowbacteria bacterium]|nr:ZIP family metal transporter [Candidatus Falkowbacteria bacterium]